MKRVILVSVCAVSLMAGCATVPQGPTYGMYPPGSKEKYCAEIAYNESPTGHGGQEAATGAGE
jgi:hypothetical protein